MSAVGIDRIVQFLGIQEFLPSLALLEFLLPEVCRASPLFCTNILYLIAGKILHIYIYIYIIYIYIKFQYTDL